jgi:hypothetical protein
VAPAILCIIGLIMPIIIMSIIMGTITSDIVSVICEVDVVVLDGETEA